MTRKTGDQHTGHAGMREPMASTWDKGSTRAWRKLRLVILERDRYRCRLKLEGCTTRATHVHHLKGKAMGDDPAFLVSACADCNLKVGNPTRNDPEPLAWTGWD